VRHIYLGKLKIMMHRRRSLDQCLSELVKTDLIKKQNYSVELTVCYAFFNHLTPELNPSAQRCLTGSFAGDFAS
jgi:hypothetical protein